MKGTQIVEKLENAITGLDHTKVTWIEKYKVIELKEQARVLIDSIIALEGDDFETAKETAIEFLTITEPIIEAIQAGKGQTDGIF